MSPNTEINKNNSSMFKRETNYTTELITINESVISICSCPQHKGAPTVGTS